MLGRTNVLKVGENVYEYIKGKLIAVHPAYIVVETNGIGYQIAVANPFHFSTKLDQEILIYVHQVIREDAHTLYGFENIDAKALFLKLISVSGIGPKSGLAILASDDHTGLVSAIESDNITYLTKFPGVGKKTAQQIVLDLKGKMTDFGLDGTVLPSEQANHVVSSNADEAMDALLALGYSAKELKKVAKHLESFAAQDTDAYLREALHFLMKK